MVQITVVICAFSPLFSGVNVRLKFKERVGAEIKFAKWHRSEGTFKAVRCPKDDYQMYKMNYSNIRFINVPDA